MVVCCAPRPEARLRILSVRSLDAGGSRLCQVPVHRFHPQDEELFHQLREPARRCACEQRWCLPWSGRHALASPVASPMARPSAGVELGCSPRSTWPKPDATRAAFPSSSAPTSSTLASPHASPNCSVGEASRSSVPAWGGTSASSRALVSPVSVGPYPHRTRSLTPALALS